MPKPYIARNLVKRQVNSEPLPPESTSIDVGQESSSSPQELSTPIMNIEEVNLEWSETRSVTSSSHDLSEWIEYYLPHGSFPPPSEDLSKLGTTAMSSGVEAINGSLSTVPAASSPPESKPPDLTFVPGCSLETSIESPLGNPIWSSAPVQYFMADTSWPDPVPLVESSVSPLIASILSEPSAQANWLDMSRGSYSTGPSKV